MPLQAFVVAPNLASLCRTSTVKGRGAGARGLTRGGVKDRRTGLSAVGLGSFPSQARRQFLPALSSVLPCAPCLPLAARRHVFPSLLWLPFSPSVQVNIEFLMPASACLPWCVGRCFVCHTHVNAHAWGLAGAAGSTGTQGQVRVSFGGLTRRSLCLLLPVGQPDLPLQRCSFIPSPPLSHPHTHIRHHKSCACVHGRVCATMWLRQLGARFWGGSGGGTGCSVGVAWTELFMMRT